MRVGPPVHQTGITIREMPRISVCGKAVPRAVTQAVHARMLEADFTVHDLRAISVDALRSAGAPIVLGPDVAERMVQEARRRKAIERMAVIAETRTILWRWIGDGKAA